MSIVTAALLVAAIIVLVGMVPAAAIMFSPNRAARVKLAEAQPPVEKIQQLRHRHPEIQKRDRLDRHDSYIFQNLGLWMYGWGVILASSPNSNLSSLSYDTQQLLGVCLLLGTSFTLAGTLLGARIGPFTIAGRVSKELLSDLLGDDIRVPYALGWCGLLSTGVSLFVYAYSIWETASSRLLGTLGGGLSFMIGLSCAFLAVRFIVHSRRYIRERDRLLAEAAE